MQVQVQVQVRGAVLDVQYSVVRGQEMVCFALALDGALNFCCGEEKEGRLV